MGFKNKIEEIRNKPEHIRIRYVWLSVAVSMIFIVIIWMFSIQSGLKPVETDPNSASDLQKQIQGIKDTAPSINELLGTAKDARETLNNPEMQDQNAQNQSQEINQNESQPTNNDLNNSEKIGEENTSLPQE